MVALLVVGFIISCLVVDSIQLHYSTHKAKETKTLKPIHV